MTTAFIFPGQGSQAVGMGRALNDAHPVAARVFAEVDEALGQPLSRLMFDGPEAELTLTANAQPALMAVSLAALRVLEAEGAVLRARFDGRDGWCNRHLLARIHRYTLDRLRREIQPVSAAEFLRFLCRWQHATPELRLVGPRGVMEVVRQLAGFQAPAEAWQRHILPARLRIAATPSDSVAVVRDKERMLAELSAPHGSIAKWSAAADAWCAAALSPAPAPSARRRRQPAPVLPVVDVRPVAPSARDVAPAPSARPGRAARTPLRSRPSWPPATRPSRARPPVPPTPLLPPPPLRPPGRPEPC